MNRILIFLFFSAVAAVSCKKGADAQQAQGDGIHFGETIDTAGMIAYTSLLSQMTSADTVRTKVTGKVSGVCQVKGCWITLVSEQDTSKTEMFVKFKDYAFFMPKDLAGKSVVLQGKAYREITSVEDLRHYAEDEGKSAEEIADITEPKSELKFMASGVLILQ